MRILKQANSPIFSGAKISRFTVDNGNDGEGETGGIRGPTVVRYDRGGGGLT
jgi:hypothetical protein